MGTLAQLFDGRYGLFLRFVLIGGAFAAVSLVLRRLPRPDSRVWGQVVASVVAIALLATPILAALLLVHLAALWWLAERAPRGPARTAGLVVLVLVQIVAPIFWLPSLPGYVPLVREAVAFATNMTQLRAWGWAWDRRRPDGGPGVPFRDYAHYMLFFPAFVSGPLLSYAEFQAGRLDWYRAPGAGAAAQGLRVERHALLRVALGVAMLAPLVACAPLLSSQMYAAAATGGPARAWGQALGVYVAFYLGFSAWSEATIGLARVCGVRIPENFDRPFLSYGVADHWRRWNIRLGHWMREYVYVPLGGGRVGPIRLTANVAVVFVGMALYHHLGGLKLFGTGLATLPAFWMGWLLWGLLNVPATVVTRRWQRPARMTAATAMIMGGTLLFDAMSFMTAFFPVDLPLSVLWGIYARLAFLAG